MLLKSILNRIQPQPGFVYGAIRFVPVRDRPGLEIELRGRKNRRPRCSGCQQPGPGYDTLAPRRFEFVPLWGLLVVFVYAGAGSSVRAAGSGWKQSPGPRANISSPRPTPGSSPAGPSA